jgi:hypothetical protein
MEKIAIFDTSSGGTPTPPITPSAVSIIYGCYTTENSELKTSDSGWCNLMGGGNDAVGSASDGSVRGNVFSANFDIVTDFYIAFGFINGGVSADVDILIYENGTLVETLATINTGATTIKQRAFTSITRFSSGSAYALRFQLSGGATGIQILGWSVGVSFNSL